MFQRSPGIPGMAIGGQCGYPWYESKAVGLTSSVLCIYYVAANHGLMKNTLAKDKYVPELISMYDENIVLSKVFDIVEQHIAANAKSNDKPVVRYLPAEGLQKAVDFSISPEGASHDGLIRDIQDYLHVQRPQ